MSFSSVSHLTGNKCPFKTLLPLSSTALRSQLVVFGQLLLSLPLLATHSHLCCCRLPPLSSAAAVFADTCHSLPLQCCILRVHHKTQLLVILPSRGNSAALSLHYLSLQHCLHTRSKAYSPSICSLVISTLVTTAQKQGLTVESNQLCP